MSESRVVTVSPHLVKISCNRLMPGGCGSAILRGMVWAGCNPMCPTIIGRLIELVLLAVRMLVLM